MPLIVFCMLIDILCSVFVAQIFTSEEVELPREHVTTYLEGIDPKLGARYLEYLIEERKEESMSIGDRLVELYLKMTKDAMRKRGEGMLASPSPSSCACPYFHGSA